MFLAPLIASLGFLFCNSEGLINTGFSLRNFEKPFVILRVITMSQRNAKQTQRFTKKFMRAYSKQFLVIKYDALVLILHY